MSETAARAEGSPHDGESPAALTNVYPLYIIAFTVQLGMGIVSPILPNIMHDFSLAAWQVGMVVTMFGLARLLTDLPLGLLLDRLNRTSVLVAGTLLIVAGSMASGLAQDYNVLLGARLIMGAGSALCTVTALFSLSKAAGASSRGKAIGIYQAAMLGGSTFSPAIGGAAAAIAGWRASFFFCAVTGAISLVVVLASSSRGTLRFSPNPPRQERPAKAAGTERGSRIPWNLVAIDFTSFIFFFSMAGFRNSMVPVYGGTELGIGAGVLGLILGGSAIIRFVITLISGFASDRYGRKVILIPGILILAAGSVGFAFARDLPTFVLCLVVLSLGGFGNSIPTTMVVDAVPPGRVGMAISMNRFVGDSGMLLGPVLLGLMLDTAGFAAVAATAMVLLLSTVPGIIATVHEAGGDRNGGRRAGVTVQG